MLTIVAIAGAAATVTSDALMNPFDGKPPLPPSNSLLFGSRTS